MTGAVDLDACPGPWRIGKHRREYRVCTCGKCAVCGYPKHSGVHGPVAGQPPGSKPWGHEFVATLGDILKAER